MYIGIRVDGDAGREAGMGHVYRSLAYAQLLREQISSPEIVFFMRDFPEGQHKVRREGYPVWSLPVRPSQTDYETAFAAHPLALLIIDTLGSSPELIAAGRQFARSIITLDDLEPSAGEVDIIVNGILWATRRLPETLGKAKVYQGIEYLQLREQFASTNQRTRRISPTIKKILISTGGADGRGFAPQLIAMAQKLPFACHVTVIAGPAYKNVAEIKASERIPGPIRFSVVQNASNIADYLFEADLALITGGTVMFESAACGTPAVIVCSYEHQVPQAEWFHNRRIALNLGYFAETINQQQVANTIIRLSSDVPCRQEMSVIGKAVVDGQGIYRLMEIIKTQLLQ